MKLAEFKNISTTQEKNKSDFSFSDEMILKIKKSLASPGIEVPNDVLETHESFASWMTEIAYVGESL